MPDRFPLHAPAREWPIPPMDKQAGWKDSAFTWEMGELILARIQDGDTMKEITADPRMPAYCTVFRWMQVVPEFGEAVAEVRFALTQARQRAADAKRRARGRRRAKNGRSRERASAETLGRFLDALREGASMSEAVADPGAPSAKVVYTRVRTCPGFRAAFVEACAWREVRLEMERDGVIDGVASSGIAAANAALRAIEARRGRLRPKLYRDAHMTPTYPPPPRGV